ncbi:DUF599 domain-containing protein [Sulfitobacter sp. SK012]|uniref:DUF599 domain-containing protein n=1 Tax=Sulfitobacter sp. SK012 TaxID=1389005 RepID=UPI000E0A41EA|nr:DUF599 domain-containing protein [Sulfitobacter sp. SK012]AXI48373.1 DUF599 domain-containing protein [Sulfitobacter sp. SK012]
MDIIDRIYLFSLLDGAAVALLISLWFFIGLWIERPSAAKPSVSVIMAEYRREWMRQMVTREPRIFDAQTVASLRQGTSFFASTSMIAIGGALALIGNSEQLSGLAEDLTFDEHSAVVLEIKMMFVVVYLTNGFLKFVWANRLFGYCSVLMGAVPNDATHKDAVPIATKAAEINITAARSFNRGLRAIYFALAALAWLAGPIALIAAGVLTVTIIWRREFASHSRCILLAK